MNGRRERWSVPVLEGRVVRLEPLGHEHEDGLWEASRDPRTWRWLSVVQPQTRDEWRSYLGEALAAAEAGTEIPLVTLCHEEVAGSTRFLALRPEHGSVEIGWTWLHPSFWGAGANIEAKLLQLTHAFETWGCRRVELKTDARNERSRRALEALGASFEGVIASTCSCAAARTATARGTASRTTTGRRSARGCRSACRRSRPTVLRSRCPVSGDGTGAREMIESIRVVGAGGRVGSTVTARLAERGVRLDGEAPDVVLLCVPDRAIAEVASGIEPGPWVAHVSGATPLSALDPHERRFGLHPLQSFSKSRGPEQLDGPWAAVTAETEEARAVGLRLAEILGLRPFVLEDAGRAAYHAGAAVASNYLVTLRRAAGSLLEAAGAPPEALDPLMRGVIETGFELTGPIARGDWETVARHLEAIRADRPELEELYLVLAEATARIAGRELPSNKLSQGAPGALRVCRTIDELRATLAERRSGSIGLVPTMGSLHDGHLSLLRAARDECQTVVMSLFVNPAQFTAESDLRDYPRDEGRDLELAEQAGVDIVFAPSPEEIYPPGFQTWVEVTELGATLEGEHRPGHFRGVATVVLKLFSIVRPSRAYFGQKDAQQAEVIRWMIRDLALDVELRVLPTVRDEDGLALSSRNALLTPEQRQRALALHRALATRDPAAARVVLAESNGLVVDYVELADFDPPVIAGAVRVGSTRLIDNVPLEGDQT